MMTRQALLNVFELRRRKNKVTGSGPKLTTIIYPFIENSGICDELLSKFEAEPPPELSIF
jgi:hypothetical protein